MVLGLEMRLEAKFRLETTGDAAAAQLWYPLDSVHLEQRTAGQVLLGAWSMTVHDGPIWSYCLEKTNATSSAVRRGRNVGVASLVAWGVSRFGGRRRGEVP